MPFAGTTPKPRLICLAGFMGCGKSTVGAFLARQLAWRFIDLDRRIERRAGLNISEIFDRRGEVEFRDLENEQLQQALREVSSQKSPAVLALGGGTFAQARNVDLLREFGSSEPPGAPGSAIVIWLHCPVEELLARCVTMANRPLFRDEISFRQLYQQRLPYYQQADYRVESGKDPRRVVEAILALDCFARSFGDPVRSPGVAMANPSRRDKT